MHFSAVVEVLLRCVSCSCEAEQPRCPREWHSEAPGGEGRELTTDRLALPGPPRRTRRSWCWGWTAPRGSRGLLKTGGWPLSHFPIAAGPSRPRVGNRSRARPRLLGRDRNWRVLTLRFSSQRSRSLPHPRMWRRPTVGWEALARAPARAHAHLSKRPCTPAGAARLPAALSWGKVQSTRR